MANKNPPLLAICGQKNAGKTTLIEKLIPRLAALGISVAVIKHDGHSFSPDVPGTDTCRFYQAGAQGTAVFDSGKAMVTLPYPTDEQFLATLFPGAELILLEGFKHSHYPKIEVVRGEIAGSSVCNPHQLLAIASDCSLSTPSPAPVFDLNDVDSICPIIVNYVKGDAINA